MIVHARETEDQGSTLFAVGRYNLHLGEQSRVGSLVTFRHDFAHGEEAGASNVVPVVDGLWRHKTFSLSSSLSGSWSTDEREQRQRLGIKKSIPLAATLSAYNEESWGTIGANTVMIGPDYDPRVGFVNRANQLAVNPWVNLDLRPSWKPDWLRRINPNAFAIVVHGVDDLKFQEALVHAEVGIRLESNHEFYIFGEHSFQRLTQQFAPAPNIAFAPGNYDYGILGVYMESDRSRRISAQGFLGIGHYYSAPTQFAGGKIRLAPTPYTSLVVNYEMNRFTVGNSEAYTHLVIGEGRLALSPRIQLIGVGQYNTNAGAVSANVRFAYEFRPLSFLFLVYDHRPGLQPGSPPDQRLVLKLSVSWPV